MKERTRVPLSVWAGLAVAILLDTAVQICWKEGAKQVSPEANVLEMILSMVQQPIVWGVIVMFLIQLVNWIKVLGKADLSYAQPITSLSYVSVCAIAVYRGESLTPEHIFGILLILVGVWFISQSEHKTVQEVTE